MIRTNTEKELWAITFNDEIVWSRGGSSTASKLMVYSSEKKAQSALKNSWTRQIIPNQEDAVIKQIYKKESK